MNPKAKKTREIRAKLKLPEEVVRAAVFVRGEDGEARRTFGCAEFRLDDLNDVIDALRRLRVVEPGNLSPQGESLLADLWTLWDEAPALNAAWEEAPSAVQDRFIVEVLFGIDELVVES